MGKKYWSAAWSIYRGQGEAETDEQGRVLKNEPKPRLREGERGGGRLDFMGGGGVSSPLVQALIWDSSGEVHFI